MVYPVFWHIRCRISKFVYVSLHHIADKILQRRLAAVRSFAYLSVLATLLIAAAYIIQTVAHYTFKVCKLGVLYCYCC